MNEMSTFLQGQMSILSSYMFEYNPVYILCIGHGMPMLSRPKFKVWSYTTCTVLTPPDLINEEESDELQKTVVPPSPAHTVPLLLKHIETT